MARMELLGCIRSFTHSAMDALNVAARFRDRPATVDAETANALRGVLGMLTTSLGDLSRLVNPDVAPGAAALPVGDLSRLVHPEVAPGAVALPVGDLARLVNPEAVPSTAALPVCFLPTDVAVLAARPAPRSLHLVRTFKVEGVPMDVHIDSCSPFCLVNAASLSPAQRAQVCPYTGPRLVGGNAGGMNVRGQYSGHLEINALKVRVPWLVVDNLPMQRILG